MKRFLLITTILCYALMIQSKIEIISETSEELLFEFHPGEYTLVETNDHIYISASGIGYIEEVGAPMLPKVTYYIGVPENGTIESYIVDIDWQEYRLSKPILPNPEVIRGEKVSETIYLRDEAKYRSGRDAFIQVGEPTYYRFNRVIPLTINPADYDYSGSKISLAGKMTIGVRISGDTSQRNNRIDDLDLSSNIINYDTAQYWQERNTVDLNYAPFDKSDFWYSFEAAQDGMHQLSYQQLSDLPLTDIDPRTIRIFTTGGALLLNSVNHTGFPFREIPLLIPGEENGLFEPGDRIIFYAQGRNGFEQNEPLSAAVEHYYNPYSARTVYWLTFGGNFDTPVRRIEAFSIASPPTVQRDTGYDYYHHETESVRRDQAGFTWFTALYSGTTDTNHNFSFTLPNVDTGKPQSLRLTVQNPAPATGGTAVTGSISMTVNNNTVLDRQTWTGITYRTYNRQGNFLQSGNNNAVLTIHRTGSSALYFDYFTVRYHKFLVKQNNQLLFFLNEADTDQIVQYNLTGNPQGLLAFQINSFHDVELLPMTVLPSGHQYDFTFTGESGVQNAGYSVVREGEYFSVANFQEILPVDLTAQYWPIDALIITPGVFRDYAEQLSQLYLNEGNITAKVVDQQDIFNQFNSGMPDPNAIRLFIRHAFHNYPVNEANTLKNVTLLGSGTIDWRNFSGQAAEKNKIILFQRGMETSEDYFVDQSGNDLPDLGIGRIAVKNIAQSETVVGKIYDYWNDPTPGLWRNTLLFVADDEFTSTGANESIHSIQVQEISEEMSRGVITDKIFGIEYPFDTMGNKPQARDDIVRRVNEGRLLWFYIGHGAHDLLGHESYFRVTDIQLLNNRDKLPLFIAASCDVARYNHFGFDSLSEQLIWHPNGGSIASLAATALSSPTPNKRLTEAFLIRLINQYKTPGIALMEAKQMTDQFQNRRYTYLGDPVVPVHTPLRSEDLTLAGDPDSLFAYQKVDMEVTFPEAGLNGAADLRVYSSEFDLSYTVQASQVVIDYTKWGNVYHSGQNSVENGFMEASFLVPGDIRRGDRGRILAYHYDQNSKQDYLNYYYPKILTNIPYADAVPDTIPPEITIWLDTPNFQDGDTVSPNPTLYARLFDESGINILGEAGHKILLMEDPLSTPIDVTTGFIYDLDSYQTGTLSWQLTDLSEGKHTMQVIAFDNFNNPAVEEVNFIVRDTDEIIIERMLPYPNPISDNGYFTFVLNADAQITISIYTITGRKIRTIDAIGSQGYNQVFWDGRDQEGSRLANNTYIYKIRARQPINRNITEELGKVMILR